MNENKTKHANVPITNDRGIAIVKHCESLQIIYSSVYNFLKFLNYITSFVQSAFPEC